VVFNIELDDYFLVFALSKEVDVITTGKISTGKIEVVSTLNAMGLRRFLRALQYS
jgi:hypothetical protein